MAEVPTERLKLKDTRYLSPPIVGSPLYQCAKAVVVYGFDPGATLDLEVNAVIVLTGVPGGFPLPQGALLTLPTPIVSGDVVRARQKANGLLSGWSASVAAKLYSQDFPDGPPRPQIDPAPPFDCGSRTGVNNLLTGCDVWITSDAVEVGKVKGAAPHQGVNVTPDYGLGKEVRAWATMCADPSPPSVAYNTNLPPNPLPVAAIDPVYEGTQQIRITGLVNGARFELSLNGASLGIWRTWGFAHSVGLAAPVNNGDTLSVIQRMCSGDPPSPPGTMVVLPCSALPPHMRESSIESAIAPRRSDMKTRFRLQLVCSFLLVTFGCFAVAIGGILPVEALAKGDPPIAYIGHGAFFDRQGNEVKMTLAFVEAAQAWYRADLLSDLDAVNERAFAQFEKRLYAGMELKGQTRLVVQQRALEWLFFNSPKQKGDDRTEGKLHALEYALKWQLPAREEQNIGDQREEFRLDADLVKRLELAKFKPNGGIQILSATTNLGQAYLNECAAARVPIPPTINVMDPTGTAGWKSQGFIPSLDQFIVGSPAEVRTYLSTNPAGMCYALPRFNATKTTVDLDGVICLSQETSKACFWDNQMNKRTVSFPVGTKIPIGVADLTIDPGGRYQAGGFELLGGAGGVCTDCHAGENPYITHPKSDLGGGTLWETLRSAQGLPTFAPNRYDPLVAATWPQNDLSQAASTVPVVCSSCHVKGSAGRFPHLSNQLPGYCGTVLPQAVSRTMPPPPPASNPGSQSGAGLAFQSAWCNAAPNAATADAGDPHLTTINGIQYDFQAAGEFVALKNSDTGFELQARQSPIQTSFTPPANPYTGLASCVSLNTAVAARVGKHRVTYQFDRGGAGSSEQVRLRIDGRLTALSGPINLGAGNKIAKATSGGGIAITSADGTAVTVNPLFWTNEQYWYLDIDVKNTPAREGTLGPVLAGDWLPRAPDSSSFGPKPAALQDRHIVLNKNFAKAWRVSKTTSLFDYAAGTSTENFTDTNWPPASGQPCKTSLPSVSPLKRMQPDLAQASCHGIKDKTLMANCVFDVTVMGDRGVARGYLGVDKERTGKR